MPGHRRVKLIDDTEIMPIQSRSRLDKYRYSFEQGFSMKNRTRKKLLSMRRKLRPQFVKDTLRGLAEANAGKLSPYCFNDEDRAWLDMVPVGREYR